MRTLTHQNTGEGDLFLAGHMAPAGTYRLAGTGLEIRLDREDVLPATCDGRIAAYERCPPTWAERPHRGAAIKAADREP